MAAFCLRGFVRCISNRTDEPDRARYRTTQVETIKFENLLSLEEREKSSPRSQFVSETEFEYVRDGRLDKLAEEQLRLDMERDEQLRQEEERLKREEDAYYAAKREATKRTAKRLLAPTSGNRGDGRAITSQPKSTTGTASLDTRIRLQLKDEEDDFDLFLKSVQTKHSPKLSSVAADSTAAAAAATNGGGSRSLHSITSDNESSEEEEVDFGYWESATVPKDGGVRTGTNNLKELDLNLL